MTALAEVTVVPGEPGQFAVAIPPGWEVTGATGATLESSEMQGGALLSTCPRRGIRTGSSGRWWWMRRQRGHSPIGQAADLEVGQTHRLFSSPSPYSSPPFFLAALYYGYGIRREAYRSNRDCRAGTAAGRAAIGARQGAHAAGTRPPAQLQLPGNRAARSPTRGRHDAAAGHHPPRSAVQRPPRTLRVARRPPF